MAYFTKNNGLVREVIRNPKLASKKAHLPGKYWAFNDNVDGYSGFEIETVAATPTEKEFLQGNPDRTALVLGNDISNVIGNIGTLFPNLSVIVAQNSTDVVEGLPDIDATVIVPNTLLSSYEGDSTYSGYSDLTFDSWNLSTSTTIPYIGNSELTIAHVKLFADNAGGNATVVDKIVVPAEFTSFEIDVFNYIFLKFPNCEEIEYVTPRVPAEYQEVEYIESTGTQYIAGSQYLTNDSKVIIDFTELQRKAFANYFGTNQPYWFFHHFNPEQSDVKRLYINDKVVEFSLLTLNTRRVLTFDKSGVYEGETQIASLESPSVISNPKQIYIFNRSSTENTSVMKLYSLKVYENDLLTGQYIPCYRKSDNEIGLYDLVGNQFYTNAGTGAFLKGNDTTTYVTTSIDRPALSTCTIYYDENTSHTLTSAIVQNTLSRVPEFATCEKVIVPEWFTEYESGIVANIANTFSDMEVITCSYKCGTLDFHITSGEITQVNDIPYSDANAEEVILESKAVDQAMDYSIDTGYNGIPASFDKMRVAPPMVFPNLSAWTNRLFVNHQNIVKVIPLLDLPVGAPYFANFSLDVLKIIRGTQLVCSPAAKWIEANDCSAFTSINLSNGYGVTHIILTGLLLSANLSTALSTSITREELVLLINSLGTPSAQQTLTIGSTNLAKLTAEDIAIATNKGWLIQ